jgi:hypothetical protein
MEPFAAWFHSMCGTIFAQGGVMVGGYQLIAESSSSSSITQIPGAYGRHGTDNPGEEITMKSGPGPFSLNIEKCQKKAAAAIRFLWSPTWRGMNVPSRPPTAFEMARTQPEKKRAVLAQIRKLYVDRDAVRTPPGQRIHGPSYTVSRTQLAQLAQQLEQLHGGTGDRLSDDSLIRFVKDIPFLNSHSTRTDDEQFVTIWLGRCLTKTASKNDASKRLVSRDVLEKLACAIAETAVRPELGHGKHEFAWNELGWQCVGIAREAARNTFTPEKTSGRAVKWLIETLEQLPANHRFDNTTLRAIAQVSVANDGRECEKKLNLGMSKFEHFTYGQWMNIRRDEFLHRHVSQTTFRSPTP